MIHDLRGGAVNDSGMEEAVSHNALHIVDTLKRYLIDGKRESPILIEVEEGDNTRIRRSHIDILPPLNTASRRECTQTLSIYSNENVSD